MNATVQRIAKQPHIAEALATEFDIDFSRPYDANLWFSVRSEEEFSPFAGEGAGGVFLLGNSSGFVLFVSSEGKAGVVAASLSEFLQIVLAYPNWRDLLKFSGGGQLAEMERAAPFINQEAADDIANIEESRRTVIDGLSLSPAPSPISALHHAVTVLGKEITVHAPDGSKCEGLFGSFVVENNRMWRDA